MSTDLNIAWRLLTEVLPERHYIMLQGPRRDGTYTLGIVRNIRPVHQILRERGDLFEILMKITESLRGLVD